MDGHELDSLACAVLEAHRKVLWYFSLRGWGSFPEEVILKWGIEEKGQMLKIEANSWHCANLLRCAGGVVGPGRKRLSWGQARGMLRVELCPKGIGVVAE